MIDIHATESKDCRTKANTFKDINTHCKCLMKARYSSLSDHMSACKVYPSQYVYHCN